MPLVYNGCLLAIKCERPVTVVKRLTVTAANSLMVVQKVMLLISCFNEIVGHFAKVAIELPA